MALQFFSSDPQFSLVLNACYHENKVSKAQIDNTNIREISQTFMSSENLSLKRASIFIKGISVLIKQKINCIVNDLNSFLISLTNSKIQKTPSKSSIKKKHSLLDENGNENENVEEEKIRIKDNEVVKFQNYNKLNPDMLAQYEEALSNEVSIPISVDKFSVKSLNSIPKENQISSQKSISESKLAQVEGQSISPFKGSIIEPSDGTSGPPFKLFIENDNLNPPMENPESSVSLHQENLTQESENKDSDHSQTNEQVKTVTKKYKNSREKEKEKKKEIDIKFHIDKKYPEAEVQKLYDGLELMTFDKFYPFRYIPDDFQRSFQLNLYEAWKIMESKKKNKLNSRDFKKGDIKENDEGKEEERNKNKEKDDIYEQPDFNFFDDNNDNVNGEEALSDNIIDLQEVESQTLIGSKNEGLLVQKYKEELINQANLKKEFIFQDILKDFNAKQKISYFKAMLSLVKENLIEASQDGFFEPIKIYKN